jgi:hypothetical protein
MVDNVKNHQYLPCDYLYKYRLGIIYTGNGVAHIVDRDRSGLIFLGSGRARVSYFGLGLGFHTLGSGSFGLEEDTK